jgi:peptidyl-prolyl cis-trans isomerase A (cyclophilin A)
MKTFCRLSQFAFFAALSIAMLTAPSFATAPDHFSFAYETTQGEIQFDCPQNWAPLGEQRLYELVTDGFFSNTAFFRVITGFVAQFGISGDPTISAKWENANLVDDPVVASNVAGTLTYADGGPNTRTTQMFINLVDNVRLDAMGFAPICKTDAAGLAVAQKFYAGYGEGTPDGNGPSQDLITAQGDSYLKAGFPKLDYVLSAILK